MWVTRGVAPRPSGSSRAQGSALIVVGDHTDIEQYLKGDMENAQLLAELLGYEVHAVLDRPESHKDVLMALEGMLSDDGSHAFIYVGHGASSYSQGHFSAGSADPRDGALLLSPS
eukprot:m51a1_g11110 hypothetical protein (115) ;mRNA; r:77638-78055